MDVPTLTNLFASTFTSNPNQRKAAELDIRKVGTQEGMITALIQIIGNNNVDLATRQACVVWLKNRVQRAYHISLTDPNPDHPPIHVSDRVTLRQNIIPLLIAAPSRAIRVQLTACIKLIIATDFPDDWPELLDHVMTLLSSEDLATVYGGLLVHLEIFKIYKYKTPKQEKLLPKLIEKTFPILVALGQKLVSPGGAPGLTPLEAAEFLHVINKTYMVSIYSGLSKQQQANDSIVPWGTLFLAVVSMQLPAGVVLSGDKDEWEKHAWWKSKKWAYRTLNKLFERYGNPTHIPQTMKKQYNAFATHFVSTFAPEIFKVYLQQVELYIGSNVWLSNKCMNLVFTFFEYCVKPKATWTMLKPHAQTLVSRLVFPRLRIDKEKVELFEYDPVDYVRQTNEDFEDYTSPQAAAVEFLLTLATTRSKSEFVNILEFVNRVLRESPAPEDKYAALNMVVALSAVIMRNDQVRPAMESFCMTYVYPEFTSQYGFLREINNEATFRALIGALDDPALPVRVQAALSLGETIQNEDGTWVSWFRLALAPGIEKIMQDLFKLSDDTDLDALSTCMESFIEVFKEQLLPVSPQLIARLCQSYLRLLQEQSGKVDEEEEAQESDLQDISKMDTDDKTFALMGIAKTISTVLACFDDIEGDQQPDPKIFEIQEHLVGIITETLKTKVIDLYDTAWDLVDTITFRTRSIAPGMWPVLRLTYDLFKSTAMDYLEEILPGLCNFLLFGKEGFIQIPENTRMVLDIFSTALTHEHLGEHDAIQGFKLSEAILLSLKGHIDDAIPTIVNLTTACLSKAESPQLQLAGMDNIVNALFYNPALTMAALEQTPGGSRAFFDKWFAAMHDDKGLPRVHDKKLSILTLCELLKMDTNAVPPSLKDGWSGLVGGILALFKALPAAEARRNEMLEEYEDEEESGEDQADMDEDDVDPEPNGDEDGDVYDKETAYLDLLAAESARLRAKQVKRLAKAAKEAGAIEEDGEDNANDDEDGEYEESDNGSDDDVLEDFGVETAIDDVDPYSYFKQTLTGLQTTNPALYQVVTTSLSVDQQTELMEVMAHEDAEAVVPSS
ncbi:hypothetical protein FRB99_002598 [Tulasnella sp. 403]|nr:hypothetical protein FRB99_002598 [Tulasnella sp. 403]